MGKKRAGGMHMGYWTKYFSTLFKGVGMMSFKQRWNARKVVNDLRKADKILFKKLPEEIEHTHQVTKALRDEAHAMNNLKDAANHAFKLIYEAEVQEDALITSINKLRKALSGLSLGNAGLRHVEGQLIEGMVEAMKRADEEEREAYKDVMAVIIEAQKGDGVLRQVIRQRFQTLKSQTALAKWAARFEVKTTAKQIRTINAITAKLPSLKGGSLAKKLPDLLTQAKYAIHDAFHESFLIQKRAIYWILNVLYNLYLLRDMGYRYVKSHFMPEKPQAEEVRHIDEIIAHILKDFRTVAQGYRIIISHLESGEKELQKIEQQAMAR
ncbi:TPA: hypothetical protein HA295_00650 [Candidatus Woesearchaeota archaeon]|nr:hypothetical protein [Candidatus Woesearchaeota archaeon]HII65267.1 hypothetical protein [Candidatus Woesearchaeota archaeon]